MGPGPACAGSARPVRRRGRSSRGQRGGNAGYEGVLLGPPASRAAPPPCDGPPGPRERTHTTRAIPREIATHPFFRSTFLRRLFVLFRLVWEGRVGSRKSKHTTSPEVGRWGGEGCAGAGAAAWLGPPRRPRPGAAPAAGPRGLAGRSAVVLARIEARGRALQAAVAERRVLLGLEPQAGQARVARVPVDAVGRGGRAVRAGAR